MFAHEMLDEGDSTLDRKVAAGIIILTGVDGAAFWNVIKGLLTVTEYNVLPQLTLLVKLLVTSTLDHVDIQKKTSGLLDVLGECLFRDEVMVHTEMFDEVDPGDGGILVAVITHEDFPIDRSLILEVINEMVQYDVLPGQVLASEGFLTRFAFPGNVSTVLRCDLDWLDCGHFLLLFDLCYFLDWRSCLLLLVDDVVSDIGYLYRRVLQGQMC